MDRKNYRVLSIQSHVVSGYVGNKSATFPLQLLGFEVDPLNSVHFSNHTGYGHWKGQVLGAEELNVVMSALSYNQLDRYTHLLTGYIADAGLLRGVAQVVKDLRKVNPSLVYVCDPVMGDNGQLYVPEDLLPIYRSEIVPLATIITPNQFELELIVERPIKTMEDALKAVELVHELGVETVVLSSSELGPEDRLLALASSIKGGKREVFKILIPNLPVKFTGTGDLFAALFLAWYTKTKELQVALENTISTIQAVLKRTFKQARRDSLADTTTVAALELKLIQSKADIESPVSTIVAEPVLV